jgi:hypothetical protein
MSIDPTIMTPQLAELHRIIRETMEEEGVSAALIADTRDDLMTAYAVWCDGYQGLRSTDLSSRLFDPKAHINAQYRRWCDQHARPKAKLYREFTEFDEHIARIACGEETLLTHRTP